MESSSETGLAKNVSNLETVITYRTGFGATYDPSNSEILLSDLATASQKLPTEMRML